MIIIVLLATTPRSEMHAASYVFGSDGIMNQTGGWNTGLAFLFGLLSVQWTVGFFEFILGCTVLTFFCADDGMYAKVTGFHVDLISFRTRIMTRRPTFRKSTI